MIRKIISIDESKCTGCGLCVDACHEGAIGMVNGKAKLLRDDYCDGLGDCLPACPTNAISFIEREAAPYDRQAVEANNAIKSSGCPGHMNRILAKPCSCETKSTQPAAAVSELKQWPVQIKLANPNAAYLEDSHILIAADCCAYAYGNFHHDFMKDKITLVGCPKLDEGDYADKLQLLFSSHQIKSITVTRMEVPCCSGIVSAVERAIKNCGQNIPLKVVTLSLDGKIISEQ